MLKVIPTVTTKKLSKKYISLEIKENQNGLLKEKIN